MRATSCSSRSRAPRIASMRDSVKLPRENMRFTLASEILSSRASAAYVMPHARKHFLSASTKRLTAMQPTVSDFDTLHVRIAMQHALPQESVVVFDPSGGSDACHPVPS